jgi:hypothetical protein
MSFICIPGTSGGISNQSLNEQQMFPTPQPVKEVRQLLGVSLLIATDISW